MAQAHTAFRDARELEFPVRARRARSRSWRNPNELPACLCSAHWRTPSAKVDRILGAAELRCVAKLSFLQIVNGCAHQGHRQGADVFIDIVLAKSLRSKETPVGFPKQHLHRDRLRAWIIASVRIRMEVECAQPDGAAMASAFLWADARRRRNVSCGRHGSHEDVAFSAGLQHPISSRAVIQPCHSGFLDCW